MCKATKSCLRCNIATSETKNTISHIRSLCQAMTYLPWTPHWCSRRTPHAITKYSNRKYSKPWTQTMCLEGLPSQEVSWTSSKVQELTKQVMLSPTLSWCFQLPFFLAFLLHKKLPISSLLTGRDYHLQVLRFHSRRSVQAAGVSSSVRIAVSIELFNQNEQADVPNRLDHTRTIKRGGFLRHLWHVRGSYHLKHVCIEYCHNFEKHYQHPRMTSRAVLWICI